MDVDIQDHILVVHDVGHNCFCRILPRGHGVLLHRVHVHQRGGEAERQAVGAPVGDIEQRVIILRQYLDRIAWNS